MFIPKGNETLGRFLNRILEATAEIAQTHLAHAEGTKPFSGLNRRNKMYLSYFRDHVWGLGSLGRETASSLMSFCHARQTSLGSAVQNYKWEKVEIKENQHRHGSVRTTLGEIHQFLQLKNLNIERDRQFTRRALWLKTSWGKRYWSWCRFH